MRNVFKLGGIFAGIVLIAMGIGSIVIGTRSTRRTSPSRSRCSRS